MPKPTFIGIGAQKTGTTWLATRMASHPRVALAERKEIHFFDREVNYSKGLPWYEGQFPDAPSARAVGEFTPAYLWTTGDKSEAQRQNHMLGTAERAAAAYPDAKLIVSFRHPVDRAVSGLFQSVKLGRFRPGTPLMEAARRRPGIVEKGRYATNLEAWLQHFPRENFLFLVYEEDIRPDNAKSATLRRAFEHVGVDPAFEHDDLLAASNATPTDFELRCRSRGRFRSLRKVAMHLTPKIIRESSIWDIPGDPQGERDLWDVYEDDIRHLEELLGRPLPWRPPE